MLHACAQAKVFKEEPGVTSAPVNHQFSHGPEGWKGGGYLRYAPGARSSSTPTLGSAQSLQRYNSPLRHYGSSESSQTVQLLMTCYQVDHSRNSTFYF